ncbi:MAG: hypothetical protein HRT72_05440, partial [Flavobacteriales bacterium]|nr:hypothetical protein [Flavobacteriales bacterium]
MAENDNIEDQLQGAFEEFEMEPDDFVWENIEAELTESKKRPAAYWWKMGLAASFIGGVSIVATQFILQPAAVSEIPVAEIEMNKSVGQLITASNEISENDEPS